MQESFRRIFHVADKLFQDFFYWNFLLSENSMKYAWFLLVFQNVCLLAWLQLAGFSLQCQLGWDHVWCKFENKENFWNLSTTKIVNVLNFADFRPSWLVISCRNVLRKENNSFIIYIFRAGIYHFGMNTFTFASETKKIAGHVKFSFLTTQQNFSTQRPIISAQSWKNFMDYIFTHKFSSQNVPLCQKNALLTTLPNFLSQDSLFDWSPITLRELYLQ